MDAVSKPKTTIQQMLDEGKSRKQIIQELTELGFSEPSLMLGMELGEIAGDVVELDAQGKPIKPNARSSDN